MAFRSPEQCLTIKDKIIDKSPKLVASPALGKGWHTESAILHSPVEECPNSMANRLISGQSLNCRRPGVAQLVQRLVRGDERTPWIITGIVEETVDGWKIVNYHK